MTIDDWQNTIDAMAIGQIKIDDNGPTDRKPNDIWINDNKKNNNCPNNKRLEWRSLPEVNTQIYKK